MPVLNLNLINCAAGDVIGTGLAGCRIDVKRIVALMLIERGHKFTTEIDKDLIQELQQQGKIIFLKGVVTFADSTPDNSIDTAPGSGLKSLITEFPYEYTATFNNGVNFQKALTALSGNGNYDLALMDIDDVIWLTQNKAGEVKGYALGMHQKGKYVGNDGENRPAQSLFLQLTDRGEVDARRGWVKPDDFSASDLDGVNDVTITIDPIVNGATAIVLTPNLVDVTHLVEGLTVADFLVTVDGAPVTPTAISYATNADKVTLTVAGLTTGKIVTVRLWDAVLGVSIILPATGVLYKSNIATATVTGA